VVTHDAIRQLLEAHLPADDPWGMQDFTWWLLSRQDSNAGAMSRSPAEVCQR
jgi:hypothetical protein